MFKKRNDIHYKKLHGESQSALLENFSEFRTSYDTLSRDYSAENNLEFDETALYVKI